MEDLMRTVFLLYCVFSICTSQPGVSLCTRRQPTSTRISYNVRVYHMQGYGCGLFHWSRCYRRVRGTQTLYRQHTVYSVAHQCCYGYHDPSGGLNCVDICEPSCVHGECNVNTAICVCSTGYTGGACQDDIQECDTNNGNCDQICTNSIGSYICSCQDGFRALTADASSCADIDECEGDHGCSQICTNTLGSYYCNCQRGFQLVGATECEDVDECTLLPNGFCNQVCVNTDGSYHCDCRDGYRLHGTSLCHDIDECAEMSDNCNRVGPTPAECINTEGGYECSCSQYTGYRLSADGTTCEDVDECAEGSHVCSMLCVNTPGSYHCSCPEGYELDEDEVTCHDIDECERMISGCQHSCTNTVGSFVCTCDRGYLLSPDALSCEALSCDPTLEAPPNGTIDCDRQTVGGACNFTCDEGFTLRGGERRTCLPSLMWRERPAICDPPTCPELEPPLNGFVVFPCTREEGQSCDAVCAHGYRAIGSTVRTCIRDSTTDTLAWSDGPQCVVSDPCSPDPCANGGTCMRGSGDPFTCACNGTGYGGPTCEIAVIRFSPLQTNADGSSIILELSTEATLRRSSEIIIVTLRDSGGTRIAVLRLRRDTRNVRQTVPSTVGIMIVTLPKNKNEFLYEPRERRVFISSGTGNEETYFKQLSLPRGQLKPSCCAADDHVTISCPGATTMTISLVSPCQWSTNKARFTRTIGSVFAQSSDLILPTSISGLRYRNSPYQNSVRNSVGACEPCDTCANDDDDKCYCYAHTPQNTLEFLQTRALGFTYVNEIQMLLPSWLEMSVDLENIVDSSPITDLDMFAPITQANEEVSSIEGCEQLSTLMSGIFSVLRHDKTLSAVIDGERYMYTERLNSGDSDTTMCFAVDMCQGLDSPVHMQISQPISDILASQFLRQFTSRQWTFVFNTVSVFKNAMPHPATRQFWNGVESIKTPDVLADVSMDIDAGLVFSDAGLAMRLEFSGTVDTNYEDKVGYLEGGVTLAVDSTIDAGEQNFQLTRSNTNAYFHISEVGDPCRAQDTDLYGVSFMASYEPQPGEQFFTRLLRFTETTQKCDFEAFIPINSDYRALGLSLHTECPLLAVDELIFPKMTHTITFIGSRAPGCLVRSFIGVSSPGLVVESELISNRLPLGNILELKASPNGPDLTTVFDRNTANGPSSRLHMVQVALFGEIFLTEANIQNNQLEISANSPVFGYPAQYTITAPSNMTDWNDLEYTLQGSLLSGFITSLSAEVVSKLRTLAQSGDARRNVAQMSLDQSMERFETIEAKLMEAEENVTRAEQERMAADAMVLTAQDRVTELETQFNSSQDELRDLIEMLDGLCQEETCEDVCMAGKVCRDCTRPNFITKTGDCPFKVRVARMVRVPPYVVVVPGSWTWVPACRFSSYLTCAGGLLCQIENRGYCSGVCTRVPRFKEHIEWRTVYDEIVENKPCTVKEFTGFVPGTCCEDVDCAVFAPSPTCITNNTMCRSRRQNAIDERENLSTETRELFQQLSDARKSLSLARTAAKKAGVNYDKYVQRRNQIQMSHNRLSDARGTSTTVYDNTLEEIEPLLRIHRAGTSSGFENIFRINSVTFDTKITTSPSALGLTVNFEKLIENDNRVFEETYGYVAQRREANLERIANSIIDLAFTSTSKRSTTLHVRVGRQAEEELTERRVFESRCAQATNTLLFLEEIETRLKEVQENITASRDGTNQLSQNLTDQGMAGDEEIEAYLDLIRDYEGVSLEVVRTLEETIFSDWQASMELLYSQSGSVGEVSCDGFADCLQTAIDELLNLIGLTPANELGEEFVSLQPSIGTAEEQALELALFSNISVDDGLTRIAPIIGITRAYVTNNFWCNDPPVIVTQLPPEVNISLGDTLQLSCEAQSNLTFTYEWRRDDNVLPQFTTNVLTISAIQRLDSANYTCYANNPVGTAETIPASVNVYELPQFYLDPVPVVTYLGDDAGAWFACNATAWPYPGWRWFHRSSPDRDWDIIEGEDTNELLILNPQDEHQGWYACEAFNFHGSLRSEAVTLTLLPLSVTQHLIPLEFSIAITNHSCSLDDLYDSVYMLLEETIASETVTIEDYNVTEIDVTSHVISLNILSRDVTTPYLHQMAYDEIANLVLPHTQSLMMSIDMIRNVLDGGDIGNGVCPGTGDLSVGEGSVVVGKRTYVCPSGQRLNTDYLLCLSCERGRVSVETELSRIVNGVGYSENVPVCQACPLDTYSDALGSPACLSCPKYHTTDSTGATSIHDCLPQPLVLECSASTTSGHVTIDCKTNRRVQKTLCSFNDGVQHLCSYPVDINRDVSPLGNHSLTISVEDDEGFTAEAMVSYFLQEDIKPTAPAAVPPLVVSLINGSPLVRNDSVEVDISLSRPVQSLVCTLRGDSDTIEKDCSGRHVVFESLNSTRYTLRVVATNRHPDTEFIKRRFEITSDPQRCTLYLINRGITVSGDSATVEFSGRGPANGYHCVLDKIESFECSSPVKLSGLTPGEHLLKVVAVGCRNRMNLKTKILIP